MPSVIPPSIRDTAGFQKHYLTLTQSQKDFPKLVVDWIENPRHMLVVLSGGPGTGKTYTVHKTLQYVESKQLRMAFTARSAHGIGGSTIHSAVHLDWSPHSVLRRLEKELVDEDDIQKCIQHSQEIVKEFLYKPHPNIIVIDEVAMINGWLMYWLIRFFMDRAKQPLLFVVMGDQYQLNPVQSNHNLFSMNLLEKEFETHYIQLLESKRFTSCFAGHIQALQIHVERDETECLIQYVKENFPVVDEIDAPLLRQATRAMAFRNVTVEAYNKFYIRKMLSPDKKCMRLYCVIVDSVIRTKYVDVKPECMIFVNKNGCSDHAMNGTQLIFKGYLSVTDEIVCADPETNQQIIVRRDFSSGMFPIELGFAATVHKFQGQTLDDAKIIINFEGNLDTHMIYTALSRVRQMDQILAVRLGKVEES